MKSNKFNEIVLILKKKFCFHEYEEVIVNLDGGGRKERRCLKCGLTEIDTNQFTTRIRSILNPNSNARFIEYSKGDLVDEMSGKWLGYRKCFEMKDTK